MLFGYLAACTQLELVTGVIILPQRQTALVAKQAAEVDLLTEGRFRLGVGIGWNAVEYEALGESFADRGRRMSEQMPLLRRLLSEPSSPTTASSTASRPPGLAPLPVQRPIPIWIGGAVAAGLPARRPARRRLVPAGAAGAGARRRQGDRRPRRRSKRGRDPATMGMEGRVSWSAAGVAALVDEVGR